MWIIIVNEEKNEILTIMLNTKQQKQLMMDIHGTESIQSMIILKNILHMYVDRSEPTIQIQQICNTVSIIIFLKIQKIKFK